MTIRTNGCDSACEPHPFSKPNALKAVIKLKTAWRGEQTVNSKEEWRDVAQSGQRACISNEVFSEWFPPGIEDGRARLAARAFAEYNGMRLMHDEARKQVCLILNNPE